MSLGICMDSYAAFVQAPDPPEAAAWAQQTLRRWGGCTLHPGGVPVVAATPLGVAMACSICHPGKDPRFCPTCGATNHPGLPTGPIMLCRKCLDAFVIARDGFAYALIEPHYALLSEQTKQVLTNARLDWHRSRGRAPS